MSKRDGTPGERASRSVSPPVRDSGSAQVSATVRTDGPDPPQRGHTAATGAGPPPVLPAEASVLPDEASAFPGEVTSVLPGSVPPVRSGRGPSGFSVFFVDMRLR
ncbi:hypothetical protein GCM10027075_04630 [Streptomyces heilongjiangensis]